MDAPGISWDHSSERAVSCITRRDWNELNRLFRTEKVLLVLIGDKINIGYALLDSALDVHFVSPTPVYSPWEGVGAQHAAPLLLVVDWWCIYETDI